MGSDTPLRVGIDTAQLTDHARTGIPLYIESLLREYLKSPATEHYVLVGGQKGSDLAALLRERGIDPTAAEIIPTVDVRIAEAVPKAGKAAGVGWLVRKWDGRLAIPVGNWVTSRRIVPAVEVFHHTSILRVSPSRAKHHLVTIYDLTTRFFPDTHNRVNIAEWERVFAFGRDRAAMVITDSESAKADIVAQLGIPEARVRAIPLGVRMLPTVSPESRAAILKKLGIGTDERFVLAVGSLEPRKNLPRLIEAFAALVRDPACADVRLVLTGARLHGAGAVEEALRRHGVGERVLLTGYVSDSNLAVLLQTCAVFAYPSLYEGFGLPVVEAMAHGAPVVTSNLSSLPEVAGDAALLMDPRSPEAIAEGLRRVLTDEDVAQTLRERGKARAACYSWERCAAAHRVLYREIGNS